MNNLYPILKKAFMETGESFYTIAKSIVNALWDTFVHNLLPEWVKAIAGNVYDFTSDLLDALLSGDFTAFFSLLYDVFEPIIDIAINISKDVLAGFGFV